MHQTTVTKVKEIAYCDPLILFEAFHQEKWAILLDSALQHDVYGRYSYIAIDPFSVLWARDGRIEIDRIPVSANGNPFDYLKTLLNEHVLQRIDGLPPFQGGAAGAFSYDLNQYLENIPSARIDKTSFPDMAIGLYDVVISFDHHQKKGWLVSSGLPEKDEQARCVRAKQRLDYYDFLIKKIRQDSHVHLDTGVGTQTFSSNFTATDYTRAVQRVQDYILAGDIFEANISQCFSSSLPSGCSPLTLYKRLRSNTYAPFSSYLNLGDIQVLSASPERFIKLQQGRVETRPIKGTRKRCLDPVLDRQLADELLASEKDWAENVMIVDLLRNDLSKVCQDHSVHVTQLCGLETYASVHHLVSVICGELQPDKHALDLLMAAFPSGSVTGAPRIRAMEIIADIEPSRRGMYCGSVGFIGFDGSMDTSIAIRTYTVQGDTVTFQAGGAVVVDSDPWEEYKETLIKSRPLHHSLRGMHDPVD